jgi:hypothetical protein
LLYHVPVHGLRAMNCKLQGAHETLDRETCPAGAVAGGAGLWAAGLQQVADAATAVERGRTAADR